MYCVYGASRSSLLIESTDYDTLALALALLIESTDYDTLALALALALLIESTDYDSYIIRAVCIASMEHLAHPYL